MHNKLMVLCFEICLGFVCFFVPIILLKFEVKLALIWFVPTQRAALSPRVYQMSFCYNSNYYQALLDQNTIFVSCFSSGWWSKNRLDVTLGDWQCSLTYFYAEWARQRFRSIKIRKDLFLPFKCCCCFFLKIKLPTLFFVLKISGLIVDAFR